MVQIKSSTIPNGSNHGLGKRGGTGGGGRATNLNSKSWMTTIGMMLFGVIVATMTSHFFIFRSDNSNAIGEKDKSRPSSRASNNKTSSVVMDTENEDYYDPIFKNPLHLFIDKLQSVSNGNVVTDTTKSTGVPREAIKGFQSGFGGGAAGSGTPGGPVRQVGVQGAVPHTGPRLNAETVYPVGPNFQDEIKSMPTIGSFNISFLSNAFGLGGGSKKNKQQQTTDDGTNTVIPPSAAFQSLENALPTAPRRQPKNGKYAHSLTDVDPKEWDKAPQESVFDCDSAYGKCVYFYPSHFFSNQTVDELKTQEDTVVVGPEDQYTRGSNFFYILEEMEALLKARKLWINMPYIGLWTMSFGPHRINPVTKLPFRRQNVTFIHIHKTGGTTIVRHANAQMTALTGKPTSQFRVFMWQWLVSPNVGSVTNPRLRGNRLPSSPNGMTTPGANPTDRTKMQKLMFDKAVNHLRTATTYQTPPDQTWDASDHELFAVVRDPLDRFISAIGQAMGAMGSAKNGVANELKRTCINAVEYSLEASQFTLQCMIDMIRERGFFFEIHFTPQAVETAFATQMLPDTPIALFDMNDLADVLTEIGCDPNKKVRDGGKNYRPAKVLQGMTSADYTPDLIKQVCELYEVDVIMMRTLGHEVPRCDEYIPKTENKAKSASRRII